MSFTARHMSAKRTVSGRPPVTTPAAWAADYDLMAFAENLDIRTFKALSLGLGLGELRAAGAAQRSAGGSLSEARPVIAMSTASATSGEARAAAVQGRRQPVVNEVERRQVDYGRDGAPKFRQPLGRRLAFERRLMAWSVDLLFVTSTLATALAIVTAVASARATGDTSLLDLRPVTWIAGFSPYQVLLGVYAIYLIYSLTFKFAVGQTFGESLLSLANKAKAVPETA